MTVDHIYSNLTNKVNNYTLTPENQGYPLYLECTLDYKTDGPFVFNFAEEKYHPTKSIVIYAANNITTNLLFVHPTGSLTWTQQLSAVASNSCLIYACPLGTRITCQPTTQGWSISVEEAKSLTAYVKSEDLKSPVSQLTFCMCHAIIASISGETVLNLENEKDLFADITVIVDSCDATGTLTIQGIQSAQIQCSDGTSVPVITDTYNAVKLNNLATTGAVLRLTAFRDWSLSGYTKGARSDVTRVTV